MSVVRKFALVFLIVFNFHGGANGDLKNIWELQRNLTLMQNIYAVFGFLSKDPVCDQKRSEFENASIIMKKIDPDITFVATDCRYNHICQSLSITKYPQILVFRFTDLLAEYKGPIFKRDLVHYFKWFTKGGVIQINTKLDLKNLLNSVKPTVVGFFHHRQPKHPLYRLFKSIAVDDDLRYDVNFAFCFCSNIQLCKFLQEKQLANDIVLFRSKMTQNQYEPTSLMYKVVNENYSTEALKDWILRKKHGLVGVRNDFNENQFGKPLILTYFHFNYVKVPKQYYYWRNRILNVAKLFINDDMTFAISDKDDKFHHDFRDIEGVVNHTQFIEYEQPLVVIHTILKQRFVMHRSFNRENFVEFVQDFRTGRLQHRLSVLKSEPEPESNRGPVKKLVARTFVDMVFKSTKDSFLYFFAPWCGPCHDTNEIVEELGKHLHYEPVNIFKIDGTLNDVHEHIKVTGYPTFFFVSKGDLHHPEMYMGPRTLEGMIKFIANRSTHELHGFDRNGYDKIYGKYKREPKIKVQEKHILRDEL